MTSVFSSLSVSRIWLFRGLALSLSLWLEAATASQTPRLPSVSVASNTPRFAGHVVWFIERAFVDQFANTVAPFVQMVDIFVGEIPQSLAALPGLERCSCAVPISQSRKDRINKPFPLTCDESKLVAFIDNRGNKLQWCFPPTSIVALGQITLAQANQLIQKLSQIGGFFIQSIFVHLFQSHKSRVILGGQDAVGKPFAANGAEHIVKPVLVGFLPLVVAKRLLVQVAVQVKRSHGNVSAFERPLQERPEVFQAVRMHSTRNILRQVVNERMEVVERQPEIAWQGVRIDAGAELYVPPHVDLQGVVVGAGDDICSDFPAPFQQPLDDGLANGTTALNTLLPLDLVHVGRLASDECFIDFNFASHLAKTLGAHGQSHAVQHEPSRLLGHPDGSGELATTNAVLGVGYAPNRYEPLIERQRRIFKYRIDLDGKLLSTTCRLALQQRTGPNHPYSVTAALGAGWFTVKPLGLKHVLKARFGVGEVTDGL